MNEQNDTYELAALAAARLTDVCPDVTGLLGIDPADTMWPVINEVLAQTAAQQWIQKQLDETGIRAMDFRNGMHMDIDAARGLLAHQVAAARTMLGDAPNYTETKVEIDVKVAESPELYTIVIQRHAPGALTPHEARQQAEARVAELERELAQAQPNRGDKTEQWLKAQRDRYDRHGESSEFWHEFDRALDEYRLHADTGTPLGEHVCEAKVVGDCECLESTDG